MQTEHTINVKRLVPWIVYLIFFAVLNETVFNVSTPAIAGQFTLSASGVSWVMTIFMVFFGIGSVIYGKLSDIFSLRKLIFIGIIVYNIGSVLGFAFQTSYPMIIAARAIQGIGASAIPALIFVIVARYIPETERGKIFGFITSMVSVAVAIGPVVGGFVAGALHWSVLFLIALPALVAIPFLGKELPDEKRKEGSVDIIGAILVALTVGSIVVYLNFSDWYYLVAFAVLLVLSIIRMKVAADPFIKPDLFKNVKFRAGVLVGFCLFSIVLGIMFLIPLMLNDIHGFDPSLIGLILFPGAIAAAVFGPIGGNLADRRGNSFVVTIGLSLLVAAMALLFFTLSLSPIFIAVAMLLIYTGFALFQTAMINSVSQTLPGHETGVGMGLFNLVSIISGALGAALVGKILDGKWFDFALLSLTGITEGFAYSNLMLVFAIIVILGGVVYLSSFRSATAKSESEPSLPSAASAEDVSES